MVTQCATSSRVRGGQQKRWTLTRRGRFIFRGLPLLTLLVFLALGALSFVSPFEAQAGESDVVPALQEVRVKSGQSLWDIAYQAEPEADTRDVVQRIMQVNDLTSSRVEAGQILLIPRVSS